jgi:hypothetical protein
MKIKYGLTPVIYPMTMTSTLAFARRYENLRFPPPV